MATVNVFNLQRNCKAAFDFCQISFWRFPTLALWCPPGEDNKPLSEEDANRIMHVTLPISKRNMFPDGEVIPSVNGQQVSRRANNIQSLSILKVKIGADKIFNALSAGGRLLCLWLIPFGEPITECLQTNLASIGWSILMSNHKQKKKLDTTNTV